MKKGAILASVLLLLMGAFYLLAAAEEISAAPAPVALFGWDTPIFQKFLKVECEVQSDVLKLQEKRIPVEEFSKYRLVILCGWGSGLAPLTDEDNAVVKDYLQKGGMLLVYGIYGWVDRQPGSGLVWAEWPGAVSMPLSRPKSVLQKPDHPFVNHLKPDRAYSWFSPPYGLFGAGGGWSLIGDGRTSIVHINRYGKGAFFYLPQRIMTDYCKNEWFADEDASGIILIVKKIVTSVISNEPALDKVLPPPAERSAVKDPVVVMLGDSTTLCTRNKPGAKLTDLVQDYLGKEGLRATVVNSGKGGDTVKGGYARLQEAVLSHRPQIVSISFGLNDTGLLKPEDYLDYLDRMIQAIRQQSQARILLVTSTPFNNARHAWRDRFSDRGGLDEYMDANFCAQIRTLAGKYRLPLCDLHVAFREKFAKEPSLIDTLIMPDGVHLTDNGNRAAAESLAPMIADMLRRKP